MNRPSSFSIPDSVEFYSRIMAEIEPDLLPEAIPELSGKYAHESAAQLRQRGLRYHRAFQEFEARAREELALLKQQNSRDHRVVTQLIETVSSLVDEKKTESIFDSFDIS